MAWVVAIQRDGVVYRVRVLTQEDVYHLVRMLPDGFAEAVQVDEIPEAVE